MRELARCGIVRRYKRGSVLIHEGEHGDAIYIVLSGRLRAYSEGPEGREITYGWYGAGECLGEMSLDGGPRAASVMAVDDSVCAMIPRDVLRQRLADDPDLTFELISRVIRRARLATEHARGLALLDVAGRLVALLETLAQDAGDGTRVITQRLTHQMIAERIGASRIMVTRVMKELAESGHVRIDRRRIRVLRPLSATAHSG